jgi:hypothetical protein
METIVELFVKPFEFMHKIVDVAFAKVELGNLVKVLVAPYNW